MNYILFDYDRSRFLPFTHTRPIADIRCGILTMRERWEKCLHEKTGTLTAAYLQTMFPMPANAADGDNIFINGSVFGNHTLVAAINKLEPGQKLVKDTTLIAARISGSFMIDEIATRHTTLQEQSYQEDVFLLNNIWDIFSHNDRAIREDFSLVTNGRKSAPIPEDVTVSGKEHLFIEEGANIYAGCIINAKAGPVYIGKDAEVLEGTMIRGPLALCEHTVLKMGAKIYGATTIGPGSKVGGEINNVVFFANSNKAHDGYLGNAVIGEWCNLGADTNCSNLKNNYDEVKIWDEVHNKSIKTGLTFCGLLMGDHSKCGINTMFNTGTVVGVSCNIYGGGFPEKFVPSFGWGGSDGVTTYDFTRAMETIRRVFQRRNKELSAAEIAVYQHIFDQTADQRKLFANG